ncbi:branched-chain amino acid transport system [Bdellovibrio bacteriovorus W]|nr:branched-chain amino acid transport system [Bdellovibrio bacteriovorus W]
MSVVLETKNVTMRFGGLKAVSNLDIVLHENELAGLIGPNGAGKTTVFNLLTGIYQPTEGDILLSGTSLQRKKPYQINQSGVSRTFQNIRLFKEMSVLDNVLIAGAPRLEYSFFAPLLRTKKFESAEKNLNDKAMQLLEIFKLQDKAHKRSDSLSYGEQRRLEIVRCLATNPKILLLDEPAAGMNHSETHSLMETISKIRKEFNLSILLIEHDMKLVMGICEKIFVLDHGTKIAEGKPEEIQKCPKVIAAYLGTTPDQEGLS